MIAGCVSTDDVPDDLFEELEGSCLLPVLASYLRNDSLLDMATHDTVYVAIMETVRTLAGNAVTIRLLDELENQSTSMVNLLKKLNTQATTFLKACYAGCCIFWFGLLACLV